MAGIYIHIPFCKQKCFYCDFYKSVNKSLINSFIPALKKEIFLRKGYLSESVKTIYFGGGTPSVLECKEVESILIAVYSNFKISKDVEITFEANPDDLNRNYLKELKKIGVNRLSIGIQSLNDDFLKLMNRRHTAEQAVEAVYNAELEGFKNMSVDLIYGLPKLSNIEWRRNLQKVLSLPIVHLSAYHLTYHKGTPFYLWKEKGKIKELTDKESVEQFYTLINEAGKMGFEQYEISNFAKNRCYSKHNSAYWRDEIYLGVGPSAHSYNRKSRQWNVASVSSYIDDVREEKTFFEKEMLSQKDKYNEYILTRIRTKWGISISDILLMFGKEKADLFVNEARKFIKLRKMIEKEGIYTLTPEGLFVSDDLMLDFMII